MTVLGTILVTLAGKKKRVLLVRLVDLAEFWPTTPAPTAAFSVSWPDRPVVSYPLELAGKVCTVTFGRLHGLLQRFAEAGTTAWGGHDHLPIDYTNDVEYFTSSKKDGKQTVDGGKWWAVWAPVTSGATEEDEEWRKGQ